MHDLSIDRFSLHQFSNRESIRFSIEDYSRLKYGSGTVGKQFGRELAEAFYNKYYELLYSKQLVVTESAYQYMRNAASLITDEFISRLNELISEMNGNFIHRTKINRHLPYIADYGKVSLKKRVKLLEQDCFTFDAEYCKDKFIIFIDDIFITGTHQKKIEEMVTSYGVDKSNCMCVYYAELLNPEEDPTIESYLNSAFIEKLSDLKTLIENDSDYQVIVRTAKMILGWKSASDVEYLMQSINLNLVKTIYRMSLGEGYYKNPAYSKNFSIMRDAAKKNALILELQTT